MSDTSTSSDDEQSFKRKRNEEKRSEESSVSMESQMSDGVQPTTEDREEKLAKVNSWVRVFPWLLGGAKGLSAKDIRRRLKSHETHSIKVDKPKAQVIHAIVALSYPTDDDRKLMLFKQFRDVFEAKFSPPRSRDEYLKLFEKKAPGGGAVCGYVDVDCYATFPRPLQRLEEAYDGCMLVHVVDARNGEMHKPDKVLVVAGESGSGKTHAALSCNPQGVTILLQFAKDVPHVKEESAKGLPEIADEERLAFAEDVVNKCVSLLPAHKNLSYLQHVPLHIVIDEMGRQPNRLRVAISESSRIFQTLEEKNLGWKCEKMKMFCLGTGVSQSPTVISSMPKAFHLCTLGASSFNNKSVHDNVLLRLFAEIRCQEDQSHQFEVMEKEAVKHFSEHRLIKPLLDNYRAAAILASHVHRVLNSLQDKTQHATLMSSAEYALFCVSQRFKSLNGLSSLKPERAMSVCGRALRQSLCGPTIRDVFAKRLAEGASVTVLKRDADDDKLVSTYGIMTEHVEEIVEVEGFIVDNNITTIDELEREAEKNADLSQLLRLPRFAISRSVASMMSGNFGLGAPPVSSQSGEGLEHAITMKFVLIMRCFRSIEAVRAHVLTSSTACVPPKASVDAIKPLPLTTSNPTLLAALESGRNLTNAPPVWTGLRGVHLRYLEQHLSRANYETKKTTVDGKDVTEKILSPDFVKCNNAALRTLGHVYDAVHEGKAVVMLNAKGAPYADVVVVAAGFVCLVQCKQATTFDVPSEVYKMMDMQHNVEITDCLCKIAGVLRSDVVVLFVTTGKETSVKKQNQSEDKQTVEKGEKQTELQRYSDDYPCEVRVSHRSAKPHEDVLFPFVWPSTPVSTTELHVLESVPDSL